MYVLYFITKNNKFSKKQTWEAKRQQRDMVTLLRKQRFWMFIHVHSDMYIQRCERMYDSAL